MNVKCTKRGQRIYEDYLSLPLLCRCFRGSGVDVLLATNTCNSGDTIYGTTPEMAKGLSDGALSASLEGRDRA